MMIVPPTQNPRAAQPAETAARFPAVKRPAQIDGRSNQVLQTKLAIGSVNDPLERAADRVADAVVSGAPLPAFGSASTALQAKCAECEAEETVRRQPEEQEDEPETIRTKAGPGGPSAQGAVQAASAIASGGAPLSRDVRSYFEPRFGRDLSDVRVHAGGSAAQAARQINARAYTLGQSIAFASGEYAPSSHEGRRLIAHELAHVVQQDPSVIRRVIRVDPQVSLDSSFSAARVTGVTRTDNVYSRAKGGETTTNLQDVLVPMLSSPRVFNIDGQDSDNAAANLTDHAQARMGIVAFAARRQYSFASVTGFTMNPQYYTWNTSTMTWKVKPGVDRQEAWDDLNRHPELYAIGCKAARDITQAGGSRGSKFVDMPSTDESDWVPGDAGYVKNTKFPEGTDIAYLGENIIYMGGDLFWGHLNDVVATRTLDEWKKKVKSWNGGSKVDTERELPSRGLA